MSELPPSNSIASITASPFSSSWIVISAHTTSGGVVSSTINNPVVSDSFPQSSVAVNRTVTIRVPQHSSTSSIISFVKTTSPQTSSATALPLAANHSSKSCSLPAPSHSTTNASSPLSAGVTIVGAVSSITVKVASLTVSFPHSSTTVNVTSRLPV